MAAKHAIQKTTRYRVVRYFFAMLLLIIIFISIPVTLLLNIPVIQAISLENAFRNIETGNVLHIPFTMWQASYDLYMVNSDGTGLTPLTSTPECECYPAWSPDGSKIAFSRYKGGHAVISIMEPDGSNVKDLFEPDMRQSIDDVECSPAWSPDGKHIAFTSSRDGNPEIYIIDADGSNLRNLTNHPAVDALPDWSPDGSEIAFASSRDGNAEIYVTNLDSDYMENVSNSRDHDEIGPKWMRNGETLVCMPTSKSRGELSLIDRKQKTVNVLRLEREAPILGVCPLDMGEVVLSDGYHVFAYDLISGQSRTIMNSIFRPPSADGRRYVPMSSHNGKILLQISDPDLIKKFRFRWLFLCADGQFISPSETKAVIDNALIIFPQGNEFALVHAGPRWKGTYAFVRADGAIDVLEPQPKEISSTATPLRWPYFDKQGGLAMPPWSVALARDVSEQTASAPPENAIEWVFLLADGSLLGPDTPIMKAQGSVLWIVRDGTGLKFLRRNAADDYVVYATVSQDRRIKATSTDTPIALWWPYIDEDGNLTGMGCSILDARSVFNVPITITKEGYASMLGEWKY